MTPELDATALLPEIIITATIGIVVVVDLFVGGDRRRVLTCLATAGVTIGGVACCALLVTSRQAVMVGGGFVVDDFALVTKAFFIFATAIVLLLGVPTAWKGEYLALLLASLLGSVLVVSSRELITFIVAFELLAVPGYLLTGWRKKSSIGHEAALKFYLLGVVATAVMLYGASLLFGAAGSTSFVEIAVATRDTNSALVVVGILFVVFGMAFKFSAVPLHFWAPDAYQGAPLPVAAFLSVVSKSAGLFAMAMMLLLAVPGTAATWAPVVAALAIASIVLGNVVALRQSNIVRLLAYSSVAQTGYAMVPIAVALHYGGAVDTASESLFAFMVIFALGNLAVFGAVLAAKTSSLSSLNGLFYRNPLLASVLAVGLLSLAGIPPFGGWFAKLIVFRAALEPDSATGVAMAIVVALGSAIGLYFYAAVVARLWRRNDQITSVRTRPALTTALGVCVIGVVVVGVFPALVTSVAELARL